MMARILSRSLTWVTILAMMDLLFMAAIANDGSIPNSSNTSNVTTTSSQQLPTTFIPSSTSNPSSFIPKSFTSKYNNLTLMDSKIRLHRDNGPSSFPISYVTSYQNDTPSTILMEPGIIEIPPPENSSFLSGNRTMTAQVNSNALIPCMVKNSAEAVTVSWIRRELKAYHLLTVGLGTYSSDNRFQVIHAQSPEDWTLKIRYVQPRDAGIYECSISTHPPSSIFVTLNVVEAHAEIPGGPDKYIKSGSTLRLVCEFKLSTEQPEYVFWFQGIRMINYDPSRNIEVTHERYSSTLVLNNVQKSDSGNYTCDPSNASPAFIFVHIINGENPAAMQHGSHSTTCVPCPPVWFLSIILLFTLQHLYFQWLNQGCQFFLSSSHHNHHHHHHHHHHHFIQSYRLLQSSSDR